jgi:excisionase family DNA binding protein
VRALAEPAADDVPGSGVHTRDEEAAASSPSEWRAHRIRTTEVDELSTHGKKRGVTADPKRPYGERVGVLLTRAEAADYLGITERQMHRMLGEGDIRKTKVRGLVRVHIDDLTEYIARQRERAVTE